MRFETTLITGALLATAAARLQLINPALYKPTEPKAAQFKAVLSSSSTASGPFNPGAFTKRKQTDSVCKTRGESHWAGHVDVTKERRLFYWFFDSRNDPARDPVIVWLNGGPGSSSMFGLFNEVGPCQLNMDAKTTRANPHAWNANASILFLDQPAGVGFSMLTENAKLPSDDFDGAEDFQTFLKVFFEKAFPDRKDLPIHVAAESYGGHFGPVYLSHIQQAQKNNATSAFRGKIQSLVLVNAIFDSAAPYLGQHELFCAKNAVGKGILDKVACDGMAKGLDGCRKRREACNESGKLDDCYEATGYCFDNIALYYDNLVQQGKRSPYDIKMQCPGPGPCMDKTQANETSYLNQISVKVALGVPLPVTFVESSTEMLHSYAGSGSYYMPRGGQVASLLDLNMPSTGKPVKVLAINGNDDCIVNTPGTILAYDDVKWSGQKEYRHAQWKSMPKDVQGATGKWKGTKDGKLVLVTVDGAGHMVPKSKAKGSAHILQKWLAGGWK